MMKGQIYSFIVILIVIPILLFILTYISALNEADNDVVDKIIADQIHQAEEIISDDFDRALKISGRRAILSMVNIVVSNATYITESEDHMVELMLNGSYDNESIPLMFNNTIYDWSSRILNVGIGYEKVLNFSNLTVGNYDGFRVNASMNYYISVTDRLNKTRVEKNGTKIVLISTEGFEDPLLLKESGGFVSRKIIEYPYDFHALKVFAGTTTGNCSGNLSFNPGSPDPNEILVTTDSTGDHSGWKGVISENAVVPTGSTCYMLSATDAVNILNNLVNENNYNKVYLDEITGVWMLPIDEALSSEYYSSFATSGPNMFGRLEGNLNTASNGLESFLYISGYNTTIGDQITIDYLYFDPVAHQGYGVRILEDDYSWLRLDCTEGAKYNISELVKNSC